MLVERRALMSLTQADDPLARVVLRVPSVMSSARVRVVDGRRRRPSSSSSLIVRRPLRSSRRRRRASS
jgi:hypothetical protein